VRESTGSYLDKYIIMKKIRMFEEKVADLIKVGEITTPCHLYIGQEAVAAGVCANLSKEDFVFSTHRSHGHFIAKGGDLDSMMAEIYCKETGCSKGRGGSMHLSDPNIGFPGSTAIVGGDIPLAVGAALAFKTKKKNNVSVVFFGDGAVSEGVFFEALNFSSLYNLPVIFICENNLFSTHMPISKILNNTNITELIHGFKLFKHRVDGNDVLAVEEAMKQSIERATKGEGPSFIECLTYRWRGHVGPNLDIDKGIRTKEELDSWINRCPIKQYEKYLIDNHIVSETQLFDENRKIAQEIDIALEFAQNSPYPDGKEVLKNVFR
jgi:acetoin:2,6-dichlorophenolindophenol oxidoreductase subunit alpha